MLFGESSYVPFCQLARYFFCAGVRTSIVIPMDFSFNREISESIFSGTLFHPRHKVMLITTG
jgi:hypothetical protein